MASRLEGTATGVVLLARPAVGNAMSLAMVEAFCGALDELEQDAAVKAIIVTGEGAHLCAGLDADDSVTMYRNADDDRGAKVPSLRSRLRVHDRYFWGGRGLFTRLVHCPKVTIAAVRGAAHGLGLYLTLCCDLVVAGETATFALPRFQLLGADGDLTMLINAVGLKRMRELVFYSDGWDARAAQRYGLVDEVVPDIDVDSKAQEFATIVSGVVRDGIAAEKYIAIAAMEKMQVGTGFAIATMMAAMASNIHHRPGEFNFLKAMRDHGRKVALLLAERYLSGEYIVDGANEQGEIA